MQSERDLRIDTLRGLALCVIAVAHLNFRSTNWIWDWSGHTSFAEAFVLLSGIVSGLVYGRMALRSPRRAIWRKALERARLIYGVYLGLVLYIAAYTWALRAAGSDFIPWGGRFLVEDPWRALQLAPFFLYQPGFANILPMYCVFVALMPFALFELQRGNAARVLGISAAIWLAAQVGLNGFVFDPVVTWVGVRTTSVFNLFAWQILFVFGLWIGVRRASGHPVQLPNAPALVWLLIPLALCSFAIRHEIFFGEAIHDAAREITRRRALMPLRLANFAALVYLVAKLGTVRPRWLELRWLAFLGQHSLQVFAFSVAACYVAQSVRGAGAPWEVAAALAVVASLVFPAWAHVQYREYPRTRGLVDRVSNERSAAPLTDGTNPFRRDDTEASIS